jgi:hypothetical protein
VNKIGSAATSLAKVGGAAFLGYQGEGLNAGESYEDAARREMLEETGVSTDDPGPQVAQRTATFPRAEGDFTVRAERSEESDQPREQRSRRGSSRGRKSLSMPAGASKLPTAKWSLRMSASS